MEKYINNSMMAVCTQSIQFLFCKEDIMFLGVGAPGRLGTQKEYKSGWRVSGAPHPPVTVAGFLVHPEVMLPTSQRWESHRPGLKSNPPPPTLFVAQIHWWGGACNTVSLIGTTQYRAMAAPITQPWSIWGLVSPRIPPRSHQSYSTFSSRQFGSQKHRFDVGSVLS